MFAKTKTNLLVIACLAVAAGFALPSFVRIERSSKRACYATLKMLEGAKIAWMMDHQKGDNDIPTWSDLVGPDRYLQKIPQCPHGGTYTLGKVGDPPKCSIPECNAYYSRNQ